MERQKFDSDTKKKILDAKKMIEDVSHSDGNEAETRRRVERIFEQVLGYDVFKHMSREYAVKGAGETEFCDWVINLDDKEDANPYVFVEIKRVNVNLAPKHLKQITYYAINAGCEWVILTNGKEWRLHHICFGQPPQTKLLDSWNLLEDDPADLAQKFNTISYRNLKRGGLEKLWEKRNVLTVHNILKYLVSEDSLKLLHRQLNKISDVNVSSKEVVTSIKHILNESAQAEMDSIKISLPQKKKRTLPPKIKSKTEVVTQSLKSIETPPTPTEHLVADPSG